MKIEFVKETKIDGDAFYFTQIDGSFVDKSLSYDIDKAKVLYNNIIENKGKINFKEVLESVEIDVAESKA
jgi:hypothetical protein